MENEFMKTENIIEGRNIQKRLRNFELNIPKLNIPKGFATALIGENGAGKTTLLNILSGIRLDAKGDLLFFNEQREEIRSKKSNRLHRSWKILSSTVVNQGSRGSQPITF